MHDPRIDAHDRAARDELPRDRRAAARHLALEHKPRRGVRAQRLGDDGVQVRELGALGVLDGRADGAGGEGVVDFLPKPRVRVRRATQEVQDGAEPDGGAVGAGDQVGGRKGDDLGGGQLGLVLLGDLEEAGEDVAVDGGLLAATALVDHLDRELGL